MTETVEQEATRRWRAQLAKRGSGSPGSLHAYALEDLIIEQRATAREAEALRAETARLRGAALGLRADLLNRAEWCPDAGKVVCAGNGAWQRFSAALEQGEVK